ncbi:MAG: TIGR02221 family CRISPR-associated protein [Methylococcus sp.]
MTTLLISFLGRPQKKDGGYEAAVYELEGRRYRTTQFATALAEHYGVDTLRVLGTAGSMWDLFAAELDAGMMATSAWEALEAAVPEDAVTQTLLDAMAAALNQGGGRYRLEFRLIPYGLDEAEQVATLRMMAEGLSAGDRLLLDVTHGLRHLPMLGLMSAFYVRAVAGAEVAGIHYAAFDRKVDGVTPVMSLNGLMRLYDWVRALECFNKDGDYGGFADLLTADGLRGGLLAEAAFLERAAVAPNAKRKLDSFTGGALAPDSPAGRLFLPVLMDRIEWRRGRDRAAWEGRLARDYLARRDYLRAGQFAFESLISARALANGADANDYDTGRQTAERELEQLTKEGRLDPKDPGNFITLKNLRNALSHGLRARVDAGGFLAQQTAGFIDGLLADEARLRAWLEQVARNLPR